HVSPLLINDIHYEGLASLEYAAYRGPIDRLQQILRQESLAFREIHSELAQLDLLHIRQPDRDAVEVHDLPDTRRDRAQEVAKLQIRGQGIRHLQEQLQPVVFALQFCSC